VRAVALTSAALEKKTTPRDDPQGLHDRAELLRDSADKLLQQATGLAGKK
jgi:hypothetical protein